jgi:lipopolysaccharide/colanic/teichoic acid biosynthesis glycosyltransferase
MNVAAPNHSPAYGGYSRTKTGTASSRAAGAARTATVSMHPEIGFELVPTHSADLSLFVTSPDDIFPAERSEALSRALNVAVAAIALVLLAPVIALVALAVRLTSDGPVLYSQTRVGVDRRYKHKRTDDRRAQDFGGKPFEMYKFRSMRVDAEKNGVAVWAKKGDSRVTPIGAFLRKTRLDELPQLYNVLRGEMNIVGPRPERPTIFAEMRETIPQYQMRQRVKPGITGWAQINQAYDSCIDDVRSKVNFDLEYLKRQSLGMDLRIMATTVPVMVFRRGGQ